MCLRHILLFSDPSYTEFWRLRFLLLFRISISTLLKFHSSLKFQQYVNAASYLLFSFQIAPGVEGWNEINVKLCPVWNNFWLLVCFEESFQGETWEGYEVGTDVDGPGLLSDTCLSVVINKATWLSLRLKTVTELFYNFYVKARKGDVMWPGYYYQLSAFWSKFLPIPVTRWIPGLLVDLQLHDSFFMLAPQETFCRWLLPPRPWLRADGSIARISIQMVVDSFFSIPKSPLDRQFKDLVSAIYTISEARVRRNLFGLHAKSRSWICVTNLEAVFLLNETPADPYCDCSQDPGQSIPKRVGVQN